jgi:transcriptional regulator with GAF, ATPase, and Fis domain
VTDKIQLGKKYSLARAAVQMEDFTAAELVTLTGVAPGTVDHFIHTLSKQDQVRKVSLPANGRGRPRKSYQLSEKGKEHLLRYMRMIRLKIEPDAVPFPELEYNGQQAYAEHVATGKPQIVGSSEPLRRVLAQVSKVAPRDTTILVLGETGTGKELIAREIHNRSSRRGHPFVMIDCAAIPEALLESELFGSVRGAFTGAEAQRAGGLELAGKGTLFLDEVGDLPLAVQSKLLRVLKDQEIERVGGGETVRAEVRVIAATHRDLTSAVAEGRFREDLFYRLNVHPIRVPALRERREDIPLLVEYLIGRYARRMGKEIRKIDKKTMDHLQAYDWPGNIRELENVVERAVILSEGETFFVDHAWLTHVAPELGASVITLKPAISSDQFKTRQPDCQKT